LSPSPQDWLDVEKVAKKVFGAVDWAKLGEIYFHEDGERQWQERRQLVIELGGQLARRLALHVKPEGMSLWAGAGVAELPVCLSVRNRDLEARVVTWSVESHQTGTLSWCQSSRPWMILDEDLGAIFVIPG
jgi:hypothetical protein